MSRAFIGTKDGVLCMCLNRRCVSSPMLDLSCWSQSDGCSMLSTTGLLNTDKVGWSTSDASIWRSPLGASTTVWRIEIEYDVPVSKSWGIVWSGSESRRLEHNRFHHTQLCRRHAEGSTRQNQLYLPGAAQAAFTVKAAARFFCIVWLHSSLITIKISGLLSRSGRQCFSPG